MHNPASISECVLLEAVSHQHIEHAAVQLYHAVLDVGGLGPTEGGAKVLAAAVGARRQPAGESDELLPHDQHARLEGDDATATNRSSSPPRGCLSW